MAVSGDGNVTVPGVDFMRGVSSIWFGKINQPELGDALISRIPEAPKAGTSG